jgi:hypothetical protein
VRLEEAVRIPWWARVIAAVFAVLFGLMSYWMVGLISVAGAEAAVAAVIAGAIAAKAGVSAVLGRWKWVFRMWFAKPDEPNEGRLGGVDQSSPEPDDPDDEADDDRIRSSEEFRGEVLSLLELITDRTSMV